MPRDIPTIKADTSERIARVRGNLNLSELGRQAAIARIYQKARAEVDAIKAAAAKEAATNRSFLERRLFSLPANANSSDMISYRDAQDRVATVTDPAEALQLMHRATMSGDKLMAKALLGAAFSAPPDPLAQVRADRGDVENPWAHVVDVYLAEHSRDTDDVNELIDMNAAESGDPRVSRIHESITGLSVPEELSGVGDWRIAQLAEQADSIPEIPQRPAYETPGGQPGPTGLHVSGVELVSDASGSYGFRFSDAPGGGTDSAA